MFQISSLHGDAGFVTAAAGAKVGIMSNWTIERIGVDAVGMPRLRFRSSFLSPRGWVNPTLMNLDVKKQVFVQMRTRRGVETKPIIAWGSWTFDGQQLILEDVQLVKQEGKANGEA